MYNITVTEIIYPSEDNFTLASEPKTIERLSMTVDSIDLSRVIAAVQPAQKRKRKTPTKPTPQKAE